MRVPIIGGNSIQRDRDKNNIFKSHGNKNIWEQVLNQEIEGVLLDEEKFKKMQDRQKK